MNKNKIIAVKAKGKVKIDILYFKNKSWSNTAIITAIIVIKIANSFFGINIAQTIPIRTELKPIIPALIKDFSTPTKEENIKLKMVANPEKIPILGLIIKIEVNINKPKNLFSRRKT